MIVYLPNDDIAPIVDYLKRGMLKPGHLPSAREANALARLFNRIDLEKQGLPYGMWERNHEADRARDSGALAVRARPARRKPARKRTT